jgi:16S rRNA (adenine1518-N6/adenine1519-N6)-dimethyltransferase
MNNYISSPTSTLSILKKNNIVLRKTLGQNFLVDTNILKKIVRASGTTEDDIVLEIGSGIGSLTEILAQAAKKVICIEIDCKLVNAFNENFSEPTGALFKEKIVIINEDAMKTDFERLNEQNRLSRVVSNLPYKIAAPFIIKILTQLPGLKNMLLTIQKDIAERLLSKPGDKYYSSYCVKANYLADFKILFSVPRKCFFPVPNIDSVVMEVIPKNITRSEIGPERLGRFFSFIEYCFIHRRKKLINSLEAAFKAQFSTKNHLNDYIDKKDLIVKMLHGIGKGADIRAEHLSLQDFEKLFLSIYSIPGIPIKK